MENDDADHAKIQRLLRLVSTLYDERNTRERERDDALRRLTALVAEYDDVTAEHATLSRQADDLAGQVRRLLDRLDDCVTRNGELVRENAELRGALAERDELIANLLAALASGASGTTWAGTLRPSRTYYRTVTASGDVWCESRDPAEVVERSRGSRYLVYQQLNVVETSTGWVPWTPVTSSTSVPAPDDPGAHEGGIGD